jgi:membrane protein YdbS with pleckstrin-like domain
MRIKAAAIALAVLAAAAVGETVLRTALPIPLGLIVLPLLLPLFYLVFVSPGRRYRAWGYRAAPDELELRRGVWTAVETVVPLERVQHIDISQGPLERSFGVCRILLHTAGTLHSQVVLPGLARARAEAMRDEIRARIRQQA